MYYVILEFTCLSGLVALHCLTSLDSTQSAERCIHVCSSCSVGRAPVKFRPKQLCLFLWKLLHVAAMSECVCLACIIFHLHVHVKSDCLGCAVLLCLACLFDLACFFLSSFSSLI